MRRKQRDEAEAETRERERERCVGRILIYRVETRHSELTFLRTEAAPRIKHSWSAYDSNHASRKRRDEIRFIREASTRRNGCPRKGRRFRNKRNFNRIN